MSWKQFLPNTSLVPGRVRKSLPAAWCVAGVLPALMLKTHPKNPNKTRACAASNEQQGRREGYVENLTPGEQSQKGSGGSGVTAILARQLPSCLFSWLLIKSWGSCRHIVIYLFVPVEALFFRKVYVSKRVMAWVLERRGWLSEEELVTLLAL